MIDQADIARTVASLLPQEIPRILTLERTNWKLGRAEINLLVLGVASHGLAIPLFWTALPKAGNSNTTGRWCIKKHWGRIPLSPFSQDTATPTRTETGIPR
ncbi:hypothetical protein CCR95_12545 [Thiocystis minor]|uniref:hypothetical protein n=1 Tax=Thiocystis minor TaxID=61597 RepID=UPI00191276E0|nr:hypothetical protein [Thiocystis minor]MBK5964888.1 hypothetical protein [Thiocystis minor]